MSVGNITKKILEWVLSHGSQVLFVLIAAVVVFAVIRLIMDSVLKKNNLSGSSDNLRKRIGAIPYIAALAAIAVFALCIGEGKSFSGILPGIADWMFHGGIKILFILALTAVLIKVSGSIIEKLFDRLVPNKDGEMVKRSGTLKSVCFGAIKVFLITIATIIALDNLGIDIGPILAGAGVLGIAIGFGAQQLVRDLINGFFILLDDQIRIGDVVQIAGCSGVVESVDLRMTKLRDVSGNVHFVRNGEITVVTNMTKDYSCCVLDVGVAYRENVDEVAEVLKDIGAEIMSDEKYSGDILAPVEVFGVDRLGDSSVVIRARVKTVPNKQWSIGREFNRRIKNRFDSLGIEIPFPHITVYQGIGKDGKAPPLNVQSAAKV